MKFITKVSFLILFLLKERISFSRAEFSSDSSSVEDFDITHPLNETIVEIFQSVAPENMQRLINTIENKEVLSEEPFTSENITAAFDSIQLTYVHSEMTRLSYEFQEKKINLHSPEFRVHLRGRVLAGSCAHKIWLFHAEMNFTDYLITVVKGSDQLVDINHHYGDLRFDIKETTEHYGIQLTTSLEPMFKQFLPLVLRENMNLNVKFVQSLNKIYENLLKTRITSKHSDFQTHEHLYHYLIPIGNFTGFTLKDYTIKGLSNFQSLNFIENPLTYILQIGNIQGSISLFTEDQAEGSISQLDFRFDSLSISVSWETNRVSVAARNYTVISTKFQKELDERHATVIVDLLELSIASSIMPSMEFQRTMKLRPSPTTPEMETTTHKIIIKILSSQLTETATIKQIITETSPQESEETTETITTTTESSKSSEKLPQNESLPSQDDLTTTEKPSTLLQSTAEPLDYFISFNDVNIKLLTSDHSYPEQVQCELLNKLKFAQRINVPLDGKGNASDLTGIKLHANVSSINISIIKSNTSNENDSCHFQIQVNQIIDVTSLPSISKINSMKRSFEQLKINQKIEAVLREIINKRDHLVHIVRPIVKPTICSTLDVCSQSVKMVNEFFSGFVDKVLKKCSLRRKTNTTVI